MNLNDILAATKKLESRFNCEHCKTSCNIPYRIKVCGHIHCHKCISTTSKCSKCNIQFAVDDVFVDNSAQTIFNGINIITSQLQKNYLTTELKKSNDKSTVNSSCIVLQSEQNESKYILDTSPGEDKLIDLNCDCSNYVEFINQTNTVELIDKKNSVGETKLHQACKKGKEIEVEKLLTAGASVNAQDFAQWTPLHEAVILGNKNIVSWLISKGSVINAPGYKYDTPLHKAVIQKNIEIAKILVKNGANIYSKNYEGISPWDLADSDMKYVLNSYKSEMVHLNIPIKTHQHNIYVLGEITEDIKRNLKKLEKSIISVSDVSSDLNENVTLVISDHASKIVKPSFELLLAIIYCIPVVTSEWLEACVTLRSVVNLKDFYIIGTEQFQCDIIQRTQRNKYKLNPKLFSGCHIYLGKCSGYKLFNTKIIMNSKQIINLIKAGDGTLLKREPLPSALSGNQQPWHTAEGSSLMHCAHYVLYDPEMQPTLRYNMRELKHVPYHWLFESILRYQLVAPEHLLNQF